MKVRGAPSTDGAEHCGDQEHPTATGGHGAQGEEGPCIRHPATGEKSLYCDETYACGIDGLTEAEAAPLLKFLVEHITQPAFTCRLRWEPQTYVFWDNRICVHRAFNDYDDFRREIYRTTIAGEAPA